MREFSSLAQFAVHLAEREVATAIALRSGLEQVAVLIENTAKAEIGTYQDGIGGFPAWAPLAESTEAEKARLGYPSDAPLLRTGDMRDGISHQVEGLEALIGSPDQTMVWHELGTSKMPPRPVMGPAALRNKAKIEQILGMAIVGGIVGPSFAYEFRPE